MPTDNALTRGDTGDFARPVDAGVIVAAGRVLAGRYELAHHVAVRRAGVGVAGHRPDPRPSGRRQGPASPPRRRSHVPRALPRRGAIRSAALPCRRRRHLRHRQRAGLRSHRHGTRRGSDPALVPRHKRGAGLRGRRGRGGPGRRRSRGGTRRGHRAPRHQARQHPAVRRPAGEGHRFRHRQGQRRPDHHRPDQRRPDHRRGPARDGEVPRSRTGRRARRRRSCRPVQPRGRVVRDAHGHGALRWRHAGGHRPRPPRTRPPAGHHAPRRAPDRAGRRGRHRPRTRPRSPLRQRCGHASRAGRGPGAAAPADGRSHRGPDRPRPGRCRTARRAARRPGSTPATRTRHRRRARHPPRRRRRRRRGRGIRARHRIVRRHDDRAGSLRTGVVGDDGHHRRRQWLRPGRCAARRRRTGDGAGSAAPVTDTVAAGPADTIPIASVTDFDPEGDGREHPDRASLAADGAPGTFWHSERYDSRQFGNLKSGVGLVIALDGTRPANRLEVVSPTRGWAGRVFVSDGAAAELGGWGQPIDGRVGVDGTVRFDLRGVVGSHLLVWFTDLGDELPRPRIEVAELVVS